MLTLCELSACLRAFDETLGPRDAGPRHREAGKLPRQETSVRLYQIVTKAISRNVAGQYFGGVVYRAVRGYCQGCAAISRIS